MKNSYHNHFLCVSAAKTFWKKFSHTVGNCIFSPVNAFASAPLNSICRRKRAGSEHN
ncbi:hypothetical protein HOLleu_12662 [Holothuria leucospilota]|uniref:Uncharacterized protein n=1 Tax=Holothuria leucospilota TaxID=206669 RepID=A0A9Q1HE03_HOLLE|nr:hypothetical protein HOLleu_12662 [Holothuria leucospilota]